MGAEDYPDFRAFIVGLLEEGVLLLGAGRTLRIPEESGTMIGTFRSGRNGIGFVEQPGEPRWFVARHQRAGARDGDRVAFRPRRVRPRDDRGPAAEVVKIIERAPLHWIGLVERVAGSLVVLPLERHLRDELPVRPRRVVGGSYTEEAGPWVEIVPVDDQHPAEVGELVMVEISEQTLRSGRLRGTIREVLGSSEQASSWVLAAIRRFDLPERFPPGVQQAAKRAATRFDPADLSDREDLCKLLTITIDPPDARDFDDAISLESLAEGHVRLGVHIADVAHFVPVGGPLDREARGRGTSVYFPGRVVPMLPEGLSNGVCSLQPGVVRYTRSVFVTYDRGARVVATRFAKSAICSAARLTYEEASAVLAGEPTTLPSAIRTLLSSAEELARRIHQRRIADGMLVLTLPETDIVIERDRVAAVRPADTSFSHTLIEMFMVEANEAVSRALRAADLPHLRRVHPPPDDTSGETLQHLAPLLGTRIPTHISRTTLRKLLDEVRGRPGAAAVNLLLLRMLSQAYYGPETTGHFALASDDYCHFTSPIRRYPDLTVHRLFDLLLRRKPAGKRKRSPAAALSDAELAELGAETSRAERKAQQAEREARQALQLLALRPQVGSTLAGIVSGAVPNGVFVQLQPTLADAFLPRGEFGPDDWWYDRRTATFTAARGGRVIHLGLPVQVQLAEVDLRRQEARLAAVPGVVLGVTTVGRSPQPGAPARRSKRK